MIMFSYFFGGVKIKLNVSNINIAEKIRLEKAYLNYNKIIDKKLKYKFSYLDEWLLKKSKILLNEAENFEKNLSSVDYKNTYRVYRRGTIIKVDFGVNLGSEMSQVHFAIVLNNYDSTLNNVLTVIPLTSNPGKFNVDLGPLVINILLNHVKKEMTKLGLEEEFTNYEDINLDKFSIDKSLNKTSRIQKIKTLLEYYKSNAKNTYACGSLITTISKSRILPPINEYDIIGRKKCSSKIMDKIDNEILLKFTKTKLTYEEK